MAKVLDDLFRPAVHGVGVGLLCQGARFEGFALLFEGLDLGVDRGSEVVVFVVELFGGFDGLFAQLGELADSFGNGLAGGAFEAHGGFADQLQVSSGYLAGADGLLEGAGGGALRGTRGGGKGFGHVLQLAHRCTGCVAGEDDGIGEGVGLFAALVVRRADDAHRGGQDGEGVDEANDVAAHGAGGVASATEHVYELAALLHEHGKRGLPRGNAGGNVGKLGRHAAQGVFELVGGERHVHHAGDGGFLLGGGDVELVEIGAQGIDADAALACDGFVVAGGGRAAGFGGGGGALNAADDGFCAAIKLGGGFFSGAAQAVEPFTGLGAGGAHGRGHIVGALLDFGKAFFGLRGVDFDADLYFAVFSCHRCRLALPGARPAP